MSRNLGVPRRPVAYLAAVAGLALAVSALLAVAAGPARNPFSTPTPYDELVTAVGSSRPIAARLTGGFGHGPLPSPTRSNQPSRSAGYQVFAAAERIRAAARIETSSQHAHALGVAQVVLGQLDQGVTSLEEAVADADHDGRFLSDLSAAYLARGRRLDRPADYPRALAAAERALKAEPTLAEAHFNRALALESLSLSEAAGEAWARYLEIDASSGWAREARERRATMSRPAPSATQLRAAFMSAVAAADTAVLDGFVAKHSDLARTYVDDELLPELGAAWLRRDVPGAERLSRSCAQIAEALAHASGDRMPLDACARFSALSGSADRKRTDALAAGFEAFGRARRLYEQNRVTESIEIFKTAQSLLTAAASDYADWCTLHEAIAAYYAGAEAFEPVREGLLAVADRARGRVYRRLEGRAHWMLGLGALQRADYDLVLFHYRAALAAFEAAHDRVNTLGVRVLLAEFMLYVSDESLAWRHRVEVMKQMEGVLPARRIHTLLVGAASASIREDMPEAAVHFSTAAIARATRAAIPEFELEGRLYLARALGALDDPGALPQLDAARRVLDTLATGPLKSRLGAEFALAAASIEDATNADEHLNSALASFEQWGAYRRTSRLYGERAAARLRRGDVDGAEADLQAAIARFVKARETLTRDQLLQLSYFEDGWPVFTRLASIKTTQRRPEEALAIVDRGRLLSIPSLQRMSAPETPITAVLPAGAARLSYVVLPDRVLMWASRGADVTFAQQKVDRQALRTLIRRFRSDLQEDLPRWQERSKALYRLLISPVETALASATSLLVMPDDALGGLPFSALVDPSSGALVLDRFEVVFAAPVQAMPGIPSSSQTALVVETGREGISGAFAALPATQREARKVVDVFPGALLLSGPRATRAAVLEGFARGPRVVHFTGHAVANLERPLTSQLHLAGGESLFAYQVAEQNLERTQLVFLSACTSLGGPLPGAGLVGLSSALIGAGVHSVIGTLWDVEDDAAEAFARAFYRRYDRGAVPPARAFRAALQDLRADEHQRNRMNWALWAMVSRIPGGD